MTSLDSLDSLDMLEALDALDDYLNEYQYLVNSFSKAYLLLTRFKLNYGQEGVELLFHDILGSGEDIEMSDNGTGTGTVLRQRNPTHPNSPSSTNNPPPVILTKQDHINSLKTTFHSLLHAKIVPLTRLKQKLENDLGGEGR